MPFGRFVRVDRLQTRLHLARSRALPLAASAFGSAKMMPFLTSVAFLVLLVPSRPEVGIDAMGEPIAADDRVTGATPNGTAQPLSVTVSDAAAPS
jgi:hypothetical protein